MGGVHLNSVKNRICEDDWAGVRTKGGGGPQGTRVFLCPTHTRTLQSGTLAPDGDCQQGKRNEQNWG